MPTRIIYQRVITDPGEPAADRIQLQDLQDAVTNVKQLLHPKEDNRQQIIQFYNATVTDGRFIDELTIDPKSVARKLGIELSDSAAAEIIRAKDDVTQQFGGQQRVLLQIVAIAIIIVIAAGPKDPYRETIEVVIDSSGLVKL